MDYSEKWGVSVENAVELALIDLKLTRDQVDVIVLEEPSKGFFGIGSKLAKVRVVKKEAPKPEAKKEPVVERPVKPVERPEPTEKVEIKGDSEERELREEREPRREKRNRKPGRKSFEGPKDGAFREPRERAERPERPRSERAEGIHQERPENLAAVAEDNRVLLFLKSITETMGLEVSVEAKENEEMIFVDIEGKDSGTIIGKRGQTLDAIQYLTSLVANKGDGKYIKVVVDAENYRSKREKTLEQLANRLALKVKKSRKSVRLEPMNPYERKVIHSTLQNNPDVVTRSEGEEPYRRVIIDIK
jgi:spoIIIJ-associated protein